MKKIFKKLLPTFKISFSLLTASYIYYKSNYYNLKCSNLDKTNLVSQSELVILMDKNNKVQEQLINKFLDSVGFIISNDFVSVKIIDTNHLTGQGLNSNILKSSNEDVKDSNDPKLFISNDQSYLIEIDPYDVITKPKKGLEYFRNLSSINVILKYTQLREAFKHITTDPMNRLIVVSNNYNTKELSLFMGKHTKIIVIQNEELIKKLELKDNVIYEYKTPKLPNKLKTVALEKFIQNNSLLKDENINPYIENNPISFLINFNLFRNEYTKIPNNNLPFDNENKIVTKEDYLRGNYYVKRNILELAEVNHSGIMKEINKKDKHLMFMYLPEYSYLQEKVIDYILYESNHLFEKILITTDKVFSEKNEIYDNSPLQSKLPQFFIKSTFSLSKGKGLYSLSYFKFPEDFNLFLDSKKEKFSFVSSYDNLTYSETLKATNFKEKILDPSFREFLLEIKHEGCPTCFMLGKMVDHLSQKFDKHKKPTKFFRIDSDNDIPLFGRFNATPTYLYVRKSKDCKKIELIVPLEKNEFVFKLKKYSLFNLDKIKYHPNLMFGFIVYNKKEFSEPGYDPDLDVRMFQV